MVSAQFVAGLVGAVALVVTGTPIATAQYGVTGYGSWAVTGEGAV